MNTVNKLDELSLEDIRRLERNYHYFHEFRRAIEEVFHLLPKDLLVPYDFAVALGDLWKIYEESNEEMEGGK